MKKKVLIWGTSENCLARYVRSLAIDKVDIVAFVDSDVRKTGTYVTQGDKYCKVKSKYEYWPVESVKIIAPDKIREEKYDFLLIGSLEYANEIYELIRKSDEIEVDHEKILLVPDDIYHYAFYGINNFGNNKNNSVIFKNNNYDLIIKYNETINRSIDYDNNSINFKELKYPLDVFMYDQKATWHEMNDILQDYVFEEENGFAYVEGPYEYGKVAIEEDDTVFDCGANIGIFTALGSLKAKKGKIFAFEPVPEILKLLEKTCESYNNVITCKLALSNDTGFITMNYDSNHMMGSSIVNNGKGNLQVEIDTIDNFVKEKKLDRVDFIKADIEGAERYLLEGAKETLKNYAPKIAICTYHLEDDKEVLEKIIREANPNYIIEHKWLKLYAYVPKESENNY